MHANIHVTFCQQTSRRFSTKIVSNPLQNCIVILYIHLSKITLSEKARYKTSLYGRTDEDTNCSRIHSTPYQLSDTARLQI